MTTAGLTRRALLAGLRGERDDVERLLVHERRLEAAYRAALERDAIEPVLGRALLAHEGEHVRGVESVLRDLGRQRPLATVPPPALGAALGDRRAFARYALDLERETVAAYVRTLAALPEPRLRRPLGSIMAAGAQHAVALRRELGADLL